ncbi:MAG: Ig-like domain-containing protein [Gemmatimonadaceae bacterium]
MIPVHSRAATAARAAASLATLGALAVLGACDAKRTSLAGTDADAPTVRLSVVATNDSVDMNVPMSVSIDAFDNLSLKRVVIGAEGVTLADTTFTSATPRYTRTMTIPLTGIQSGTRLELRAVAFDGAGNRTEAASPSVVAYDRGAPVVTVVAPTDRTTFRAGDATTVTVQASDSSGIARVGFQIIRAGANGVLDTLQADSVDVTGSPTTATRSFNTRIALNLAPGEYQIRGFARDVSHNGGLGANLVAITVQDPFKPGLAFVSPPTDSNVTLGSTILATVRLTDNVGLRRLSIVGITTSGDPDLGVVDTVVRYDSVFAPVNVANRAQEFRAGLTDTTVKRLLTPKAGSEAASGPLYLIARVTDIAGNDSAVVRRVRLVSGPSVVVLRPGPGAVAAPGKSLVVELRAADRDGVRSLGYNVTGAFTVTRTAPTPASVKDTLVFVDTLVIPASATTGTFTVSPFATDNLGQPGSGTGVVVSVQSLAGDNQGPIVTQTLRSRVESDDSVTVRATDPSGVRTVGFVMTREVDGTLIRRDSVLSNGSQTDLLLGLALNVPAQVVGQKIVLRSFAYDAGGRLSYSAPLGAAAPIATLDAARPDTALVVFGRTFILPQGGVVGDVAVDTRRSRTYLSNLTFDRLEVWEGSTERFNAKKIAVGSDPWGLFVDNSGDTLLVANSGGTNISRVFLGDQSSLGAVSEVAARRIKTPNAYVGNVQVQLDNGGIARIDLKIYDYSDRPQYVAQSVNGDIYFSTKPTPTAPDGTIRRYMSNTPVPDVQQIWQYGAYGASGKIVVVNADSIFVQVGAVGVSDVLVVCDHAMNQGGTSYCARGYDTHAIVDSLRTLRGADVTAVSTLDVKSLGLSDTTFVAAGGDRQWVAFGEAHTDSAGRVMMVRDPGAFFSPSVYVSDLVNNASERVFGLALNKNSSVTGVHGMESYFFDVESPFHLRLQGKVNTFDKGAGIAFHPDNVGDLSTDAARVAFIASANGTIEIVDTYHYTLRGTLPVRASLYGPIRVTKPFPGDDPAVVLKLFGLTTEGLIVIDIRASDIQPLSFGRAIR